MALLNQTIQVPAQLGKFFETLREGQAPDKFGKQHLNSLGFRSSNHLALIPLLKGLGFLTQDGTPTERYREFLDKTKWQEVLAQAVRDAYSDIFVLKAKPTKSDKDLIAGKFKSQYNLSETQSERAAGTFLALLDLAGPAIYKENAEPLIPNVHVPTNTELGVSTDTSGSNARHTPRDFGGLCYNIQIHLPATKDIEVYNAIFKSIRIHLVD